MSASYVLSFDFVLKPDLPSPVIVAFQAVARGEKARPEDLSAFPQFMRRLLTEHDCNVEYCVWKPIFGRGGGPHYLRFVVILYENLYVNGGFQLPYEVFDFVEGDPLFCMERTYGSDRDIRHYYKDGDDVIILELERSPLSNERPLQESDVSLTFTRVTAEERSAVVEIAAQE